MWLQRLSPHWSVSAMAPDSSELESSGGVSQRINDLFSLKGKSAVVTGASGGLGARIASVLDAAGARVALVGRSKSKLDAIAESLNNNPVVVVADLADEVAVSDVVTRCRNELASVDVLVNNAGLFISSSLRTTSLSQWENMQQVNLRAPFLLAQAFASDMLDQGQGKIINMSSIMGLVGDRDSVGYSASKAGVIGLTRALAVTLGDKGVQVNALCPGFIATPMTDNLKSNGRFNSRLDQNVPARRWGTPEDLDGSILFLASSASEFMTGQVLVVDGGLLAGW